MSSNHQHFSTIADYFDFLGKPPPEHPLIACIEVETDTTGYSADCPNLPDAITADFYIISFKKIIAGEIYYGKTQYDPSSGAILFMAPGQELSSRGMRLKSDGRIILIHPDFFLGHSFEQTINRCAFFEYAINEALHLSPKEETLVRALFDAISTEHHSHYDEVTREIMLSQLKTLLAYSERFYKRQFIQRYEVSESVHSKLRNLLEQYFLDENLDGLPSLSVVSAQMGISNRYLSDAIKAETGKSAKEFMQLFLIDKAKGRLASSDDSVTAISYDLGFSSPQYFFRLFKKKTGKTPSEYRTSIH